MAAPIKNKALRIGLFTDYDCGKQEEQIKFLTSASSMLLNMGREYEALQAAKKAYELMPSSHLAQETFENLCCNLVERWHFGMLNDKSRNLAYQQALEAAICKGRDGLTVLDIGCGTGLLSLFAAAQPKCGKVYAIDGSIVMCKIVEEVLESSKVSESISEKITVINEISSDMIVPDDMPEKADVLVTEIFDAGLFGEGFLPTICHAWSNLLKKDAVIIPQGASVFVQAIECDYIMNDHRFTPSPNSSGLDMSGATICSNIGVTGDDPYGTIDLKQVFGGYKPLSQPTRLMDVDFNNFKEISSLNDGQMGNLTLEVTSPGRLDALVLWFDLHMWEGQGISTSPEVEGCWEQAVFPMHGVRLLGDQPPVVLKVSQGQQIMVHHKVKGGKFNMFVADVRRGSQSHESLENPNSSSSFYEKRSKWVKQGVYCLPPSQIARMNDRALCDAFREAVRVRVRECTAPANFVHLNHGFSTLCLEALQEGCQQAMAHAKTGNADKLLLKVIANQNNIDQKLHIVDNLYELLDERWGLSLLSTEGRCDTRVIVACDMVHFEGRLREGLSEQFSVIRDCLPSHCRVLPVPAVLEVHGVLVESTQLLHLSCVVGEDSTLGMPVGRFLNKYATKNHQGILLKTLAHKKLSKPFKMLSIDIGQLLGQPPLSFLTKPERDEPKGGKEEKENPKNIDPKTKHSENGEPKSKRSRVTREETSDSDCSSEGSLIGDPLDQKVQLKIPITESGQATAVVYWFEMKFDKGNNHYSCSCPSSSKTSHNITKNSTNEEMKDSSIKLKHNTKCSATHSPDVPSCDQTSVNTNSSCSPKIDSQSSQNILQSDKPKAANMLSVGTNSTGTSREPKDLSDNTPAVQDFACLSTLDVSHQYQASVMMTPDQPLNLTAGQNLTLNCRLAQSAFSFSISD